MGFKGIALLLALSVGLGILADRMLGMGGGQIAFIFALILFVIGLPTALLSRKRALKFGLFGSLATLTLAAVLVVPIFRHSCHGDGCIGLAILGVGLIPIGLINLLLCGVRFLIGRNAAQA